MTSVLSDLPLKPAPEGPYDCRVESRPPEMTWRETPDVYRPRAPAEWWRGPSAIADACVALEEAFRGAGLACPEIRLTSEREAERLVCVFRHVTHVEPLHRPGFAEIAGVRVTWPAVLPIETAPLFRVSKRLRDWLKGLNPE